MTPATPAAPPPGGRPHTIAELLDRAASRGDRVFGTFNPVVTARRLYCEITTIPAGRDERCASCGQPAPTRVDGIPLHVACGDPAPGWEPAPAPAQAQDQAQDQDQDQDQDQEADADTDPTDPSSEPEPAPDTPQDEPGRPAAAVHEPEILAAVLSADGLHLPGAAGPVPAPMPGHAGEAWQLAHDHRIRQLWIHPSAHEPLGLPAGHGPNPQAPEAHPWAQPDGYTSDPGGLAVWMNLSPAGGGRRRSIVLPAYENRPPDGWPDAPAGQVLLDAVIAFADAMPPGCHYYYSPNYTAATIIRHHHRRGVPLAGMPPPAAERRVNHVASWSRPLTDEEQGATWLHRYDTNGAELAVWNTKLGIGDPVHDPDPHWAPDRSKYIAGYYLASLPEDWAPRMLLPDLRRAWRRADKNGRAWIPAPFSELLLNDLQAPLTLHEAWLWPQSSAWMETSGKTLRDARAALITAQQACGACGQCGTCIARRVVNAIYKSAIGWLGRRPKRGPGDDGDPATITTGDGLVTTADKDPLWRPDARDHFISRAAANDYRRQLRTGLETGRWPVAIHKDAVYYASDDPDPVRAKPRTMVIGNRLGQYSIEASVLTAAVAEHLGTSRFHQAVTRHLKVAGGH